MNSINMIREWISCTLLSEGRLENVLAKYPEYSNAIRQMAAVDPSGNLKYLDWMVARLHELYTESAEVERRATGALPPPDVKERRLKNLVRRLARVVNLFHERSGQLDKEQRDLYYWTDDLELEHYLDNLPIPDSLIRRRARAGSEKVYDDGRYLVLFIKDVYAACQYGKGTRWCISATKANKFQMHDEMGYKFYFIIDRQGENQGNFSRLTLQVRDGTVRHLWLASGDRVNPETLPLYIEPAFFHPLAIALSRHASIPIDMIGGNLRREDISLSNLEALMHQSPTAINQTWIQDMLAVNKDGVEIFTRYAGQNENAKITPKMLNRLIEYTSNVFYLESVHDAETFVNVLQLLISHPSVTAAQCVSILVKTSELGNELGPYARSFFTFLTRTLLKRSDVTDRTIYQVANGIREERFYSGVFFEVIRSENAMLLDFIVRNGVHWHTEKVVALLDEILGDIDKSSSESFEKSALAYSHYVHDKYTDERVRSRAASIIRIAGS